jgi:hypothetical protein
MKWVAGQRPFVGVNAVETLAAILEREPPPLSAAPPELPRLLAKRSAKTARSVTSTSMIC